MQNTLVSELESLKPTALDAGLVFSGKESGRLIQGYDKPSAYTPAINPDYIFHEAGRDIVVWLMNPTPPDVAAGFNSVLDGLPCVLQRMAGN